MKFSAAFAALALYVALALAAPAPPRSVVPVSKDSLKGRAIADAVGAAYFITNAPDGNFVVSADIKSDGTLSISRATATGGRGLSGTAKSGAANVDGLFSQGSIQASKAGGFLVAVNSGSNTINAFTIDPKNPSTLTPMGGSVPSGGEFPVSVAITKDGKRVCVLNGGAVSGVNCYTADKKTGLTAIPETRRLLDVKGTTPPKGLDSTASHILFSEDESLLMASIKGNAAIAGGVAIWAVKTDGTLTKALVDVSAPSGGTLPLGMSIIPGTNALLVADIGSGLDVLDLEGTLVPGLEEQVDGLKTFTGGVKRRLATTTAPSNGSSAVPSRGQTGNGKIFGRETVTVTAVASAAETKTTRATTETKAAQASAKTGTSKIASLIEALENAFGANADNLKSAGITLDNGDGTSPLLGQFPAKGKSLFAKIADQTTPGWLSRSQKTGNFYFTDTEHARVTEMSLDKNLAPKVVKQYETTSDSGAIDNAIASVGDKDFLYVLGANKTQITVFSLDAPGQAVQKQVLQLNSAAAKKAKLELGTSIQGMTTFLK